MTSNLRPRQPFRDSAKKKRAISLTDDAWNAWVKIGDLLGCSRQEAMERIARRELTPTEIDDLVDFLQSDCEEPAD